MSQKDKDGLKKLKELLKEYNFSIGFNCSDCSDTYGIYEDRIEINSGRETISKTDGWGIDHSDIEV